MNHFLPALALAASISGAPGVLAQQARYHDHPVVRLTVADEQALAALLDAGAVPLRCRVGPGVGEYVLSPDLATALRETGIEFEVLAPDAQELIDAQQAAAQNRGAGFFEAYRTYDEVSDFIDQLVAQRPDLATRFVVGQSLGDDGDESGADSRDVFGVKITAPGPSPSGAPKPQVLFNGCQHAREWISVMVPLCVAEHLVLNADTDPRVASLLRTVEFHIVPIVNPDGYVYSHVSNRLWRKNRRDNGDGTRGVDLNRNWSVAWGGAGSSSSPSSLSYRGPFAFSEPETASLSAYIDALPDLRAHVDYHSYGQLMLGPWGHTNSPSPVRAEIEPLMWSLSGRTLNVNDMLYYVGFGSDPIGFAAGIAPDYTADQGALSWTTELRPTGAIPGFELPADQIEPTCAEAIPAALAHAAYIASVVAPLSDSVPRAVQAGEAVSASITLDGRMGRVPAATGHKVHFRAVGAASFQSMLLNPEGADTHSLTLPASSCFAGDVELYFELQAVGGEDSRFPIDAPESTIRVQVASEAMIGFVDDFESDMGWTVGSPQDDATAGVWERASPIGTTFQPAEDRPGSAGSMCFLTGNASAPGEHYAVSDVDNGQTTLTSPMLDALAEPGEAYLSFWLWYVNDGNSSVDDTLAALISSDDGATWETLVHVDRSTDGWEKIELRLADSPVALTSQMRLRFIARDDHDGSIVEAAIDSVEVSFRRCVPPPGDANGDFIVDFTDLNAVLSTFGQSGAALAGDVDGDGDVDFTDLNMVLVSFGQSI